MDWVDAHLMYLFVIKVGWFYLTQSFWSESNWTISYYKQIKGASTKLGKIWTFVNIEYFSARAQFRSPMCTANISVLKINAMKNKLLKWNEIPYSLWEKVIKAVIIIWTCLWEILFTDIDPIYLIEIVISFDWPDCVQIFFQEEFDIVTSDTHTLSYIKNWHSKKEIRTELLQFYWFGAV